VGQVFAEARELAQPYLSLPGSQSLFVVLGSLARELRLGGRDGKRLVLAEQLVRGPRGRVDMRLREHVVDRELREPA
jgi:hypothetical protein